MAGAKPKQDISISLNQDDKDPTKFNLGNASTIGKNTWTGTLTEVINAKQDMLSGMLVRTDA